MPNTDRLAQLVRSRRLALNLSLRDLERLTGVSRAALSRVEAGTKRPTLQTLQQLAPALGVGLADLSMAAGYPPMGLPSIRPYLRAAYGLEESSAADVELYLHTKYGPGSSPAEGEDELPDDEHADNK